MSKTQKQSVGALGEDIAVRFLKERDFEIIDRNYRKPYGEIDIVALKDEYLHFVEVKTVSLGIDGSYVRPEEHMDERKLHRFKRIVEVYLLEKELLECEWQYDLLAVEVDIYSRVATCRYLERIH
jgi:putative endonuclease